MNNIILFSNDCPRCKILKQKLNDKKIKYIETDDFTEIIEKNFQTAPILKYKNEYYQFSEAVKLIGEWNEN